MNLLTKQIETHRLREHVKVSQHCYSAIYTPIQNKKLKKKNKTPRPIVIRSRAHHLFQHHYLKFRKLSEVGGGGLPCKMMTSPPGQSGWELFPSFKPTDPPPLGERREELWPWPRPCLAFISPRTASGLPGIP